ncbi:FMN-binding glutamate synthase family protein [Bacillaceae bacterium]
MTVNKDWFLFFLVSLAGTLIAFVFIFLLLTLLARPLAKSFVSRWTKRLMNERYPENIWEMATAMTRLSPRLVVENSLRAASGGVIERPFGSPRKFLHFDGLVFSPAQIAVQPASEEQKVDTQVTIGPYARKPLKLKIPLLMGAMGYGIGISEKLQIAIAKGTAAAGTACNGGEGGFLPEVRAAAHSLILQYSTAKWGKEPQILKQADAIEIHIGQGASAAAASRIPPEFLQGKAREILGLRPGETAIVGSRHREIDQPDDLKKLVASLRELTGGIPIGVKICAGHRLEADLAAAINAGVDFISLDGGQAGTKGAPPILEDDFGLPTIYALSRAVRFLRDKKAKEKTSLLIGGGFFTPGECLKALALGADAVYLGTAPLWAMTHIQVTKAIPFEPPTQLVFYPGSLTEEFDEEEAAHYLKNFFQSFVEEMKIATLALGKTAIRDVNEGDLVALDKMTSEVTKIPLAYDPFPPGKKSGRSGRTKMEALLDFFR